MILGPGVTWAYISGGDSESCIGRSRGTNVGFFGMRGGISNTARFARTNPRCSKSLQFFKLNSDGI